MKLVGKCDFEIFGSKILHIANWVVGTIGSLIFAGLCWYAFRYTQYMNPDAGEFPINVHDSMTKNICGIVVMSAVLGGLLVADKKLSSNIMKWGMRITTFISTVWIGGLGYWWITAVERVPEGDQAFVYGAATYFSSDLYVFLSRGNYCDMYPQQLGLIAFMELFFSILGDKDAFGFQVLCVLFSMGIVLVGNRIVKELTNKDSMVTLYNLFMMGCIPMAFYTGWVYGDIPSIFFMLLTTWMVLLYAGRGHWGYLAGMVAAATMAVLVRKNSLIMVIALCLVGGVYCIYKKEKKLFVALLLTLLLPALAQSGIAAMYQARSGYEKLQGLPISSWIALGINESEGRYGWYYEFPSLIYLGFDCDKEATDAYMRENIKERLQVFKDNPAYAKTFYKGKILSQWNEPLYQSLFFSTKYREELRPSPDTLVAKISGSYFVKVLGICDRMQMLIYIGVLCYFLFGVRKNSSVLQHLIAVTVIGGFFFSILWEAKARYILPYYVTMYPIAVAGYWNAFCQISQIMNRFRKRETEEQIIPFEKVA